MRKSPWIVGRLGEAEAVADQIGDGDHHQPVLVGHLDEVGDAGHGAVVVHDLADHPGRLQPGEGGEVDGRLGLSGALEHAPLAGAQREDVPRAEQVLRPGRRIDRGEDGGGAVGGGDAGRHLAAGLDRDREGGAEGGGVVLHHQRQVEVAAALLAERQADQPAAVLGHEVDRRRGDLLGRDGEVPFVLAVLVVDDDDDLAAAKACDRLLDGDEGSVVGHDVGFLTGQGTPSFRKR